MNAIIIGNKISEKRKQMGLSQSDVAERMSVSPQAVSKWERGESLPDIISLMTLAEVLEVDLNYFGTYDEQQTSDESNQKSRNQENNTAGSTQTDDGKRRVWNLGMAQWKNMDFSGISKFDCKFNFSVILDCKFCSSTIKDTALKGNCIKRCNFSDSVLTGSSFELSTIEHTNFNACNLKNAAFKMSNLSECDFSEADFSGAIVSGCSVKDARLDGAIFINTEFKNSSFNNVAFGSDIVDCCFSGCSFKQAEFRGITLRNTFFKNLKLKNARFVDCKADRITHSFMVASGADVSDVAIVD